MDFRQHPSHDELPTLGAKALVGCQEIYKRLWFRKCISYKKHLSLLHISMHLASYLASNIFTIGLSETAKEAVMKASSLELPAKRLFVDKYGIQGWKSCVLKYAVVTVSA